MILLIQHQKGKDVGEILYEHNTLSTGENQDRLSRNKLSFSRKEARMKLVIFVTGIVWMLALILMVALSWIGSVGSPSLKFINISY